MDVSTIDCVSTHLCNCWRIAVQPAEGVGDPARWGEALLDHPMSRFAGIPLASTVRRPERDVVLRTRNAAGGRSKPDSRGSGS
jgi:hypothetical protein